MLRRYRLQIIASAILALVVALAVAIAFHANPLSGADRSLLDWVVAHRSSTGTAVIATVTYLFGPVWVAVATVIVVAVFVVQDANAVRGVTVAVTVAVAGVLCAALKVAVDRPRPPFVDQASTYEVSGSFPSGHVTGTTALVVATALAATVGSERMWCVVSVALALSVSVFAASTRVYLGLHWFSDVVAAVLLSAAVALVVPLLIPKFFGGIEPVVPQRLRPYLASPSGSGPVVHQSQENERESRARLRKSPEHRGSVDIRRAG